MGKTEAIVNLTNLINAQSHDKPYDRGLVNGMILAKALLTDEEPEYFGPTLFDKEENG